MSTEEFITLSQLARQYGVHESIIRGWIRQKLISYVMVGPGRVRMIRKSEVIKPIEPEVQNVGPVDAIPDGRKEEGDGQDKVDAGRTASDAASQGRDRGTARNPKASSGRR